MSSCNVSNWAGLTVEDFVEGFGLLQVAKNLRHHNPFPELWELRWPSGEHLGWADTPSYALSYKRAAARMGVKLNVYQPEV
jgi:hypothetical protein